MSRIGRRGIWSLFAGTLMELETCPPGPAMMQSVHLSHARICWVGQKVHLGFPVTSYGKNLNELLGQPTQ